MIRKIWPATFALIVALPASATQERIGFVPAPPIVTAPIAYLVDLSSGAELLDRGADQAIPPASMAKMLTTHIVFGLIERGGLSPNRLCTVRPATWQRWHGPAAGSTMFLSPGEQVRVTDLLHGIVTLSGNDATVTLAECVAGTEGAFVALMNRESRRLGLAASRWGNPVGWPDGGATRTTARDLAALAAATIRDHPRLYREYYSRRDFRWGRTMQGNQPITQGNRNPLLGRVAGADGLKTGHTIEAGYSFTGSAERNGRRLVMVIAGLGSAEDRISQSVALMNWGYDAWQARPLLRAGQRVGEARLQLGSSGGVGLVAPRPVGVTWPAGQPLRLRARIVYHGPVTAPVRQGRRIADLVIEAPGLPAQVTPLVAERAVGRAGFFGRAKAGLLHLLGIV